MLWRYKFNFLKSLSQGHVHWFLERQTLISCLPHTPWPEIQPTGFRWTGPRSTHGTQPGHILHFLFNSPPLALRLHIVTLATHLDLTTVHLIICGFRVCKSTYTLKCICNPQINIHCALVIFMDISKLPNTEVEQGRLLVAFLFQPLYYK